MRKLVLVAVLSLTVLAGCQSSRDRDFQRLSRLTPQVLYERGKQSVRTGDFAEAVQVFGALTARYPFAEESRQARLDIIHAYYRLGEAESAHDAADTFIRENPTHPRIDYAWYIKGLIDFERTPYAVERWLRVDLAARPPKTASDSFASLRNVVEGFPTSIYAADARRRMVYLRNRLASYEMQIADHYVQRGAWVAAAQRARQTIEDYDGAPVVKDALRLMIRAYRELDYTELAENTEKVFRENYPGESIESKSSSGSWWKVWN